MKKFLSIILLSLSVLVTANPIISWNCNDMSTVMAGCMEMEEDVMPCCAAEGMDSHTNMADMICCSPMARIHTVQSDLQIEQTEATPKTKEKRAAIQVKWFNSNYLTDLQSVDFTASYSIPFTGDGFKFNSVDRLSYICIYRI
ncbi:hypothetical protein HX004_15935 [Myroides sp. 1354]|uniref:hypothetical protein n=1 Tax=unclassified Myroides TaxID=2642485 RepID=UPI0025754F83|nr:MULTISPECIES: hypothetical protein [unclassified Myroides]MDM1046312.1 hypothetical protein [Myroides sp. R163-1]MDM1057249.1 hypothetical protein [Myroides sp. 1354]MDM1070422.1 hypothetical protein [Myroides sp. 1372]